MRMVALLFVFSFAALAQSDAEVVFRETVHSVLKKDCFGCHGDGQTMAKLDLRSREAMLHGGQRGPAFVPGDAENSILYQALVGKNGLAMPPGGAEKRLSPEIIAAFRTWIDGQAPWSESSEQSKWKYEEADLWALRPVRKVQPPLGATNQVDAFLLAKLKERGLKPAARADRRTLIRRVTFDLTGLPPTPEEIRQFLNDKSSGAWEKVVDRLLASPRYGERWGRHWLDVVRYADTSGYSNDFERPNAWRYRDYVIRSFNQDKPYDQFIREQIAGDEIDPANGEFRIATGFLRAGPWEHTAMSVEAVTRQMWLDDVTGAVGTTFLGLTVGCARCHDHKFDPIPTKDYYSLQAVFATTEFARPRVPFLDSENVRDMATEKAHLEKIVQRTQERMGKRSAAEMRELAGEKYEEFKLHQKHLQLYRESLDRFEPKAFAVSSGPMDGYTDGGSSLKYPKAAEYQPAAVHVLVGGNLQSPADPVAPGVLTAVERYSGTEGSAIPDSISGRRLALANWIASRENPLTARVMVNRIWQGHFGAGIAADANNFGKMGRKPTHPDLLEWLAAYFMEHGWSMKAVHRLILLSDAYQRSGTHPDIKVVREKDPNNGLLAYFAPRRLDAEVLRDSILMVAGELSPEAGGPGAFPQINEDVARQPRHAMGSVQPAYHPSGQKRLRNRRTIYMFQQRSLMDPVIEVFNGANMDLSCERREASIVPTQVFALFNSQFAHDMALAFAARVEREAGTRRSRLMRAFELAFGRPADEAELRWSMQHQERMAESHRRSPSPPRPAPRPIVHTITSELTGEQFRFEQQEDPAPFEHNLHASEVDPDTRAMADVMLGLLNSNEFIYTY